MKIIYLFVALFISPVHAQTEISTVINNEKPETENLLFEEYDVRGTLSIGGAPQPNDFTSLGKADGNRLGENVNGE